MASISDLPIEILLKIFQFYMQTESQKKFLNNVSKVCKAWNDIALDSSLWRKYDGTPTFKTMMYLSKKGALRNTKELILSSIDSFKSSTKEIEQRSITNVVKTVENTKKLKVSSSDSFANEAELFQYVPNAEIISFSLVKQISNETLSIVAQNCTKLREIKIGKRRKVLTSLNYEILVDFFSMRGCEIKKIDISFCTIPYFSMCVRCISDSCPNLEYLYLENIDCPRAVFPTGYVQMQCSKLKALYMDCNIRVGNTRHPSGFPNLEDFVYSDHKGDLIYDTVFECVVFNSPNLKFLSLTNCPISASAMLSLPARSVERLSLPQSKACRDASLADVLKKWSHSLREVDLSYGNCSVQRAVLKLIKTPVESPLQFLNLNFTPITLELVENIMKDCTHLETLKLKGCRNLLRGMKRIYHSQLDFQELTKRISSFRSTYPPQVFTINDL